MLVVIMIETPTGVANAYDIASVPGVDVVIIGNNDLASFSGFAQTSPEYQAMVTKVHDDTLRAGKIFGQANCHVRHGPPAQQGRQVLPERSVQRRLDAPRPRRPRRRGAVNPNAPPPGEDGIK